MPQQTTPLRLGFIIASVMAIAACEQEQKVSEAPLRPVKSITIEVTPAERERDFSGTSRYSEEARLSFKVSGNINELPVSIGDVINPGDIIARLDPTPFELAAQQSRANLASSKANQRNAQANYQRFQSLYENNNASRNELDSARANAESTDAQVRANQKALEIAQLNVDYTVLTTDQSCSIASVRVEVNENISAGQEIVRANCGSTLEVEIDVPESLIQFITRDTPAAVEFTAIGGKIFTAVVTEVGVAATGGGNTFPVIIQIDEEHPELRSGLAANIQIVTPSSNQKLINQIVVPAQAVLEDSQGVHVFVLEASDEDNVGIVRRREVTIGELTQEGLIITNGLGAGDVLITAGITAINDGMKVKS